jgi:hypothetical protein
VRPQGKPEEASGKEKICILKLPGCTSQLKTAVLETSSFFAFPDYTGGMDKCGIKKGR